MQQDCTPNSEFCTPLDCSSGDSRIKKVEGHCGAMEKIEGNIHIYLAW